MKIRTITETVTHHNEQDQTRTTQYLVTDNKGRYFVLQYAITAGSNPLHLTKMIRQKAEKLGFGARTVVAQWTGDIDAAIAEADRIAQAYSADRKTNPVQYYGNVKLAATLTQAKEIMASQTIEETKLKRTNTDYEDQMDASHAQIYGKHTPTTSTSNGVTTTTGAQRPPAKLMKAIAAAKAKRLARRNGTEVIDEVEVTDEARDPLRAINKFLNDKKSDEDARTRHGEQLRKERDARLAHDDQDLEEDSLGEAVAKIACLGCDEVSTAKAWQKNNGSCPKCNNSTQGVAEASYSDSGYRNMHRADQKANRQADKDRAKQLKIQKDTAARQGNKSSAKIGAVSESTRKR
jgi:hypothetical protein